MNDILIRIKALFWDWLLICGYLFLLFIIAFMSYNIFFESIPKFSNINLQLFVTFSSVIPIVIIFSIMEGTKNFASWGKRKLKLKVVYQGNPFYGSIIRNTFKFIPWQFAHMGVINGMYHDFNSPFSIVFLTLSIVLSVIYIIMILVYNRHLPDLIANSRVIII